MTAYLPGNASNPQRDKPKRKDEPDHRGRGRDMKELSLHMLDIAQNSIAAGAGHLSLIHI